MIFRVEKIQGYTVMSNYHLRDDNLSLKAMGMMSLVLSLPQNWDYSIKGLKKIIPKEGKASIGTVLKELEAFGYLKRERIFDKKGRIRGFEYVFYEFPKQPYTENPDMEKPYTENPDMENRDTNKLLNKVITKQLNINKITTTACAYEDEDVENFDENALRQQILYLNGEVKTTALISDAQVDSLNEKLTYDELEHYLGKLLEMKIKDYKFSCSDYQFILNMVEADRALAKKGVS